MEFLNQFLRNQIGKVALGRPSKFEPAIFIPDIDKVLSSQLVQEQGLLVTQQWMDESCSMLSTDCRSGGVNE